MKLRYELNGNTRWIVRNEEWATFLKDITEFSQVLVVQSHAITLQVEVI